MTNKPFPSPLSDKLDQPKKSKEIIEVEIRGYNLAIKNVIQKQVFDKITEVDRAEYDRHLNQSIKDPFYNILVIANTHGYYIYHDQDPPNFTLLDKIFLQGLWLQFAPSTKTINQK